MKKVLSILTVLAMLISCICISASAADIGSYENPYRVRINSANATEITLPPESDSVYVFVNNSKDTILKVEEATSPSYQLYYCRQPQTIDSTTGTVEFVMFEEANFFVLMNPTDTEITVKIRLRSGDGIEIKGTVGRPEELTPVAEGTGYAVTSEQDLIIDNEGYYSYLYAPMTGKMTVKISCAECQWCYVVNNVTQVQYSEKAYSEPGDVESTFESDVTAGDKIEIVTATYDPDNVWNNPAGKIKLSVTFSPAPADTGDGPEDTTDSSKDTTTGPEDTTSGPEDTTGGPADSESGNGSNNPTGGNGNGDSEQGGSDTDNGGNSNDNGTDNGNDTNADGENNNSGNDNDSSDNGDNGSNGDSDSGYDTGIGSDNNGTTDSEENYVIDYDHPISEGEGKYPLSKDKEYTVFPFAPTAPGKYTFSTVNASIGIVSNNGMWITEEPSNISVSSGSFEWTCNSEGQEIWVAARGRGETADITVTYEEIEEDTIPRESYENKHTPTAFTYDGDASLLQYVNTEDASVDTAVLGSDGYYHLNSADGPLLYADLNDDIMSLEDANSYGQLNYAVLEDGTPVKTVDFTQAINEYLENMDKANGLYPLTEDLIEVFRKVGEQQYWYGDNGWVGGTEEDAWMFACYYNVSGTDAPALPDGGNDQTTAPDDSQNNAGNTDGGDDAPQGGQTDGENVTAPQTGDEMIYIALVAIAAIGAFALLTVIRRRRINK